MKYFIKSVHFFVCCWLGWDGYFYSIITFLCCLYICTKLNLIRLFRFRFYFFNLKSFFFYFTSAQQLQRVHSFSNLIYAFLKSNFHLIATWKYNNNMVENLKVHTCTFEKWLLYSHSKEIPKKNFFSRILFFSN